MKEPERLRRALNALKAAFISGELKSGNCWKCAVGIICGGKSDWANVFMTDSHGIQLNNERAYHGNNKKIIDNTGYSWQQLAMVENAFEINTKISWASYHFSNKKEVQQDLMNGLKAVILVLCQIEKTNHKKYFREFRTLIRN